jgi:serine/threonine-protein kinase
VSSGSRTEVDQVTQATQIQSTTGARNLVSQIVDLGETRLDDLDFSSRYVPLSPLAAGGMGEIGLQRDRRIGRDLAIKTIRGDYEGQPHVRARFLREARVQGQLEHPSIVPVYDLGTKPDGSLYFTMKRVHGQTLSKILDAQRANDPAAIEKYSRRRLLTAFSSVCLAVDFAHARGVIHRDLKPANVMLGDFGEVYVLDWGVAKLVGAPDTEASPSSPDALAQVIRSGESGGALTQANASLGTVGYMPPEQLGGASGVDVTSDVYALGALLFEILTLQPLHSGDSVGAAISTLKGADARASLRAPHRDVPPELEAICVRATETQKVNRYPNARELVRALDLYLDGDRDLALRRQMAARHAESADHAAVTALQKQGLESDEDRRSALREVSHALALDPENRRARQTLMSLLLEPPTQVPREAQSELDAAAFSTRIIGFRAAAVAYLGWFVLYPIQLSMGVLDWTSAMTGWGFLFAAGIAAWLASRNKIGMALGYYVVLILSSTAISFSGRILGPFVMVPMIAAVNTLGFAMSSVRSRWPLLVVGCGTIGVPFLLEQAGVISKSYRFDQGLMCIEPHQYALPEGSTTLYLLLASFGVVAVAVLAVGRLRTTLTRAEQRLRLNAWQLRQLLPEEVASAEHPVAGPDRT